MMIKTAASQPYITHTVHVQNGETLRGIKIRKNI